MRATFKSTPYIVYQLNQCAVGLQLGYHPDDTMPLMLEAASEITRLTVDNEKMKKALRGLKAALEEMTAHIEKDIENFDDELSSKGQEMVERARKALKGAA